MPTRQPTPPDASTPDGLSRALALVGDRWTLAIVQALQEGPTRFGDLALRVPGIASNILARRLVDLERVGLVTRRAYSRRPPRFTYALTEPGRELAIVVASLSSWGAQLGDAADDGPHHDACGTSLEWRPWCPTCERVADADEASELAWV